MATEETGNYVRLHLYEIQVGTPALRHLFLQIVQKSAFRDNIDEFLKVFREHIREHIRETKSLTEDSLLVLFPERGPTDLSKWDISLLRFVLLNCCTVNGKLRELLNDPLKKLHGQGKHTENDPFEDLSQYHMDKLFSSDGISTWDSDLLLWVLNKYGYRKTLKSLKSSLVKFIKREIKLSGSLPEFMQKNIKKIERLQCEQKLSTDEATYLMEIAYRKRDQSNYATATYESIETVGHELNTLDTQLLCQIAVYLSETMEKDLVSSIVTIDLAQQNNRKYVNSGEITGEQFENELQNMSKAIDIILKDIPNVKRQMQRKTKSITRMQFGPSPQLSLSNRTLSESDKNSVPETPDKTKIYTRSASDGNKENIADAYTFLEKSNTARFKNPKTWKDFESNCNNYGKSHPLVQRECEEIGEAIRQEFTNVVNVWPAYRPPKENEIIFIVETKGKKDFHIPKNLKRFNIEIHPDNNLSTEDKDVQTCIKMMNHRFSLEDREYLSKTIQQHSKDLMASHRNLNIISASPIKSINYGKGATKIIPETCIVLYVRNKGCIPIDEDIFPESLGNYKTDVREGLFEYFGTQDYHENLKVGCLIASALDSDNKGIHGTLGAFVDLPGGGIGCITSAHAVLHDDHMTELVNEECQTYAREEHKVYQPIPNAGTCFGYIQKAVYSEGGECETGSGVEAALIQITARYPDDCEITERDSYTQGPLSRVITGVYHKEIPDRSKLSTVVKFGAVTEYTRGAFNLDGVAVRTRTFRDKSDEGTGVCLHNQIDMINVGTYETEFAKHGDSGALVLIPNESNGELHAIGILTGGNNCGKYYVTPIWEILKLLELSDLNTLKACEATSTADTELEERGMDTDQSTATSLLIGHVQNVSMATFTEFKHEVNKQFKSVEEGQLKLEETQKTTTAALETKLDSMFEYLKCNLTQSK